MKTVDEETVEESDGSLHAVKTISIQGSLVDGYEVPLEIDTGASRSILSENMFRTIWPKRTLVASNVKLGTYSKEPLPVVGAMNVNVEYSGQTHKFVLLVVKGSGPTQLGRDWMLVIRLDWQQINYASSSGYQELLNKHADVFQDSLGTFKGCKARIEVKPDAKLRYCKARTVPFAL